MSLVFTKRISRDLMDVRMDDLSCESGTVVIHESSSDPYILPFDLCMHDGPYSGESFSFKLNILPTYPFSPPQIQSCSDLWHPNIDECGGVYLPHDWSPVLTLRAAIVSVLLLLLEPSPLNAVNEEADLLFSADPASFEEIVRRTHNMNVSVVTGDTREREMGPKSHAYNKHGCKSKCRLCARTSCLGQSMKAMKGRTELSSSVIGDSAVEMTWRRNETVEHLRLWPSGPWSDPGIYPHDPCEHCKGKRRVMSSDNDELIDARGNKRGRFT